MTLCLQGDDCFDMSLRLWSDDVSLAPMMKRLGVPVQHLDVAGEPMERQGRFAGRLAKRHYASTSGVPAKDDDDVSAWLIHMLSAVEPQGDLVDQLRARHVEALLWIARLRGEDGAPMPHVDPQTIEKASSLGLRIFLENYTDFNEEGVPKKQWLP